MLLLPTPSVVEPLVEQLCSILYDLPRLLLQTLRERSPSDDQKPPGEEASVITPPPQAAKTAWPEESKAAVQKTLNPSPDNSVDGAGQPVSPV